MFVDSADDSGLSEDTICALSTPPGHGGIAVIRVSGSKAFNIARAVCPFLPEKLESHKVYFGLAKDRSMQEIDEVVVTCFAEGRSFTGEETAEISCHGSPILALNIINELIHSGARTARNGEFTYRAFMNGRLDLVQAESVLSLIQSQSKPAAKIALRQLQGDLSKDFLEVEDGLVWMLAHLEASIDFSTEDIEVVSAADLIKRGAGLQERIEKMLDSYRHGRIIRSGLQVALVGKPNVGKSSLLNALVGEDRAIVSAEAGTTRDLVEGRITIAGVPVSFIDTAGLRETENEVEKIGIARSRKALSDADVVFHVVDETFDSESLNLVSKKTADQIYCVLINKVDLLDLSHKVGEIEAAAASAGARTLAVSALTGQGLDEVRALLQSRIQSDVLASGYLVTQARHAELLKKIHGSLVKGNGLIKADSSPEFVAFELQEAIHAIHELLGKEFNEQIIDRIFKEFCLGK